jgi:tetratricopeptide (TPR) repeat protein
VRAAKTSEVKKYITSAEWCLGWTHRQLGNYRSSLTHLQAAYLLSSSASADEVELQLLHCKCGIELVESLRFEDRDKAVSLAHDVETKCTALSDGNIHGTSLVALGEAVNQVQQNQEALEHLNHARTMLQAEAVKNAPYPANIYQLIARAHYDERRFPDAIQEAWKFVESSSNQTSQRYIRSLWNLA